MVWTALGERLCPANLGGSAIAVIDFFQAERNYRVIKVLSLFGCLSEWRRFYGKNMMRGWRGISNNCFLVKTPFCPYFSCIL
jgi:hypothetical protein